MVRLASRRVSTDAGAARNPAKPSTTELTNKPNGMTGAAAVDGQFSFGGSVQAEYLCLLDAHPACRLGKLLQEPTHVSREVVVGLLHFGLVREYMSVAAPRKLLEEGDVGAVGRLGHFEERKDVGLEPAAQVVGVDAGLQQRPSLVEIAQAVGQDRLQELVLGSEVVLDR